MEKKKVLFVIESLSIGGAEKSLVTLLNLMDYDRYDAELLLFAQGGPFQKLLPEEVKLLPVPAYFAYSSIPWSAILKKLAHPRMMLAQLRYSLMIRFGKHNNIEKPVLLWKSGSKCFDTLPGEYDVAIGYAQGLPTFFVGEKVNARKKASWVNATYKPVGSYLPYITKKYEAIDKVNAVSESVRQQLMDTFGFDADRITLIRDILDRDFAVKMAGMPSKVSEDMNGKGTKILTVGRLAATKGYDLAIDAAKLLADRGVDFTWYVVGEGALRAELEQRIAEKGVQDRFVLLGSRSNPYPYYVACDLYVQTSRFEGFGITLAEARMFAKPIVTTGFEAVGGQFTNEENGLIVDISAEGIADGIVRMLEDRALREHCAETAGHEKIGNAEEIEKVFDLIG